MSPRRTPVRFVAARGDRIVYGRGNMATLVIEGIPDDVMDRLPKKANRRGNSVNAEALVAIERLAASELPMHEAIIAHIRASRDGLAA